MRLEQSPGQMRVHIASLVLHEGQADEDLPIVCLFRPIAAEDVLVVPLPFGNLTVRYKYFGTDKWRERERGERLESFIYK